MTFQLVTITLQFYHKYVMCATLETVWQGSERHLGLKLQVSGVMGSNMQLILYTKFSENMLPEEEQWV